MGSGEANSDIFTTMDHNKDPERAPLLSHTNSVTFSDKEETTRELYTSDRESSCHLTLPRQQSSWETDSDGEYLTRSTRTVPNNAPQPFVYLGFCCAILAGLCFTSSNVMVKYIPDVNSWQLLLVRCVAQLCTMIPIMYCGGHNILGTPDLATRWRIGAQGVLGGFLLLAIFEAVGRMPLGDCTAIFFSSPAFTMILSCIILKDHCGVWRCLVAITLLTVLMMLMMTMTMGRLMREIMSWLVSCLPWLSPHSQHGLSSSQGRPSMSTTPCLCSGLELEGSLSVLSVSLLWTRSHCSRTGTQGSGCSASWWPWWVS